MALLKIQNIMYYMVILLLIYFTCFNPIGRTSFIRFEGDGYSGILVAISEKVPEDEKLLNNLESIFTRASQILYTATRGKAYFKEITIVVPINWKIRSKRFRSSSYINVFSMSDIRIGEPHPESGDYPFTMQMGGCKEPGDYIHLSANLFKNTTGLDRDYIARLIVHHWARFRYGVFEEHSDPENPLLYPPFYMKHGKIFPSTCVANIPGWAVSDTHNKCTISHGEMIDDCTFHVDVKESHQITASLMSYVCLPVVDHFCDNTPKTMHNRLAPTRHNVLCKYRSTWDIVSSHLDFQSVSSKWPDKAPSQGPPETNFQWRKAVEAKARHVLVLDLSGSMWKERRIDILKAAAIRFFKDLVPTGSYVGVVTFRDEAEIFIHMEEVNDAFRESSIKKLIKWLMALGRTAIGRGLRWGLNTITTARQPTEGAAMVLISDGEETERTLTSGLYQTIRESGVIIYPIGFGTEASDKLEYMAALTGGKTFYFDTSNHAKISPGALDLALLEIIKTQLHADKQPLVAYKKHEDFKDSETFYKFLIDREIGKDTDISIIPNLDAKAKDIDVELQDPQGQTYDAKTDKDDIARRVTARIADATEGEWKVIVRKAHLQFMSLFLMVTSHRRLGANRHPLRIRGWLSNPVVNASQNFTMPLRIYAEVHVGYSPVIDATVISTVDLSDGKSVSITLLDNGRGADVVKHDGIYSAYFVNYTGNGRYPVSIEVINKGNAKIRIATKKSVSLLEVCKPFTEELGPSNTSFSPTDFWIKNETSLKDTDDFPTNEFYVIQRFLEVGSFKVANWSANYEQKIPPARVTDLKVIATSLSSDDNSLVATLTWTAPGAYLYKGTPSFIEFRGHKAINGLVGANFSAAILFGFPKGVKSPLTDPAPALTKVTMVVNVSLDEAEKVIINVNNVDIIIYDFNFALRAHNAEGLVGEISNIATAHFTKKWNTKIQVIDKPKPPKDEWPPAVWYTVITIVAIVVSGIITYFCCPWCCPCLLFWAGRRSRDEGKKKSQKESEQETTDKTTDAGKTDAGN